MTNSTEVTLALASKRATLAMLTLALGMHRAKCSTCRHGGPVCAEARSARAKSDELRQTPGVVS